MQTLQPAPALALDFAAPTVNKQEAARRDLLHHVAIAVENVAQSVDWYTKTFACSVDYQDDTWALLGFENIKLALVIPEQHPPHICFTRTDAESFGPLKLHRDGTRSIYVYDPAGNAVEVMEQKSSK